MNCKNVQEILITDYVDGQMEDRQKSLVDQHLAHCPACKVFLTSIKKEAVNPFNSACRAVPEGSLWGRIKQTIEEGQKEHVEKLLIPDFWEKFRSAVLIPRPAFALATVVTFIFMIGLPSELAMNSQLMTVSGPDQVEYLSSLIDEPVDVDTNNGNDPKTPIEQYFL